MKKEMNLGKDCVGPFDFSRERLGCGTEKRSVFVRLKILGTESFLLGLSFSLLYTTSRAKS